VTQQALRWPLSAGEYPTSWFYVNLDRLGLAGINIDASNLKNSGARLLKKISAARRVFIMIVSVKRDREIQTSANTKTDTDDPAGHIIQCITEGMQ
jgi:precorrin-6x reductase